ncbi:cytochrome b [Fulvimonas soli]|jgi:cytochrome b561|uniref:Cytochrome b561 n=1 Tax=Fulvimonas soli TaxID=155197 RepID=A0A316I7P3_9GAMM|nr:cytochrome b [Fulvimonas soli]PWK88519.1 cytochrome b561 [Fulvimonas soli]TNY24913.1 cytochrome B [Fulvimonas soli]
MPLRSDADRWGSLAKTLHWLMALGIIGVGIVGLWMTGMKPPMAKIGVYALHKSIGLTLLALALLRIAWRLVDGRPRELPAPRWQRWAAHAAHFALYVLILAIPLSGWWFNSLHGYPLQWFKLFNLPALAAKDEDLARVAHAVHEYGFWLLVLVLVAHVGGALKHHVFDGDDVLRRMWPFARLRQPPTDGGPPP